MSNTYRAAKQQRKFIESLDPNRQPPEQKISVRKDWKPLLDELVEKASKLRASGDDSPVLNPTFTLIRASLDFARIALEKSDDLAALDKPLGKMERAIEKIRESMFFSDFEF